jgi:hypothetical protein
MITILVKTDDTVLDDVIAHQKFIGSTPFRFKSYGWLFTQTDIPRATYIFADLERLTPVETTRAAHIRRRILERAPELTVLNDPRCGFARFQLLEKLFDAGVNSYRAYRVNDIDVPERYPVFIRREDDHRGPLSELIPSADAYRAFFRAHRFRRSQTEKLIAVEFLDYADAGGTFVKYGAVIVGGEYWTTHAMPSSQWMVKIADPNHPASTQLDKETFDRQPHAKILDPVFRALGAEYGRLDYAVFDGSIQVFEFNSNPSLYATEVGLVSRQETRRRAMERLLANFDRIAYSGTPGSVRIQTKREALTIGNLATRADHAYRIVRRKGLVLARKMVKAAKGGVNGVTHH